MRVDTSELRFRGVQKLVLELETRPWSEQFKSHEGDGAELGTRPLSFQIP